MRKLIQLLIIFCFTLTLSAQELNGLVTVNSDQISGSNKQVYTTLQTSLTEFINQTQWTNESYKPQEKINCAFTITISKQVGSNRFDASIQVQAARPVYGSSYTTPIINIKDTNFNFKYNEFQPLNYNETNFESNLISTIVYYVYVILGVDADTFKLNGGDNHYKKAKDVLLLAQQSGGLGWNDQVGKQNRFSLIDNLTSPKLKEFKNSMYSYHRQGMDAFFRDKKKAKTNILNALFQLENLYNKVIGNFILRFFFDSKADEIASIFSDGPKAGDTSTLKTVLQRISPTNNNKWQKIK
jgi:hypothetical protein